MKSNTELSEEEKRVLLALEKEQPASIDSIAQQAGLPDEAVRQVLQMLIAKGLIEESQLPEPLDKNIEKCASDEG